MVYYIITISDAGETKLIEKPFMTREEAQSIIDESGQRAVVASEEELIEAQQQRQQQYPQEPPSRLPSRLLSQF